MLHSLTNSQALSADGQVLFRQVNINGVLCWQAQSGRTFPVVAGAEDGAGDGNTDGAGADDAEQDSADNYDKERGFKKMQAQAADLKKLKAERDAFQLKAKELDTLKAQQKEREEAEKSELEKAQTRLAEAERKATEAAQKLTDQQNRQAIERAATKAGAVDPDDVYKLLESSDFERDADGALTNAEKLVADLLKKKPHLVAQAAPTTRGNTAGPKVAGSSSSYAEVVKGEEQRLRRSGGINI